MARWKRGEAEVEALIGAGELQKLTGEAANSERLQEKAATTLGTAHSAGSRATSPRIRSATWSAAAGVVEAHRNESTIV